MRKAKLVGVAGLFVMMGQLWGQQTGQLASEDFYKAIRTDDLAALRALVAKHGSNVRDGRGTTPLQYAVTVGSMDAIRILVAAGADVQAKNAFEATPLLLAAGDPDRAQYLVLKGADVNTKSKMGRTPLYLAAAHDGSSETVRLLLTRGADPNVRDVSRRTPLHAATAANDTASAELLLEKGAEADAADNFGSTPLMNAAGNNNLKLVKLLLAKGANVNATTSAQAEANVKNGPIARGYLTPLLMAATYGSPELLQTLLSAGAHVNAKDVRGMTPLFCAIATDHPNAKNIHILLQHGADTKAVAKDGTDAAYWARKYNDPVVLKELNMNAISPNTTLILPTAAPLADAERAVGKSIGLLGQSGTVAFQNGGCASCHSHNLPVAAMAYASKAGFPVNFAPAQEGTRGGVAAFGSFEQPMLERMDLPVPEILSGALWQFEMAGIEPGHVTDAAVVNLAAQQRREGNWHIQLARPPYSDGDIARTALIIRVLRFYAPEARKAEFAGKIARAAAWLQNAKPVTTDDYNMRLLGLKWAGARVPSVGAILGQQRADGGWAQTANLASDAFATGQTLYMLGELGYRENNPSVQRATQYLLRTQAADGSWHVVSRALKFQPYFDGGFPYEHDQWISSVGTSWAVMGLSRVHQQPAVHLAELR